MKKLFAIPLLALLLFNCIGYKFVINYFAKQTSNDLNLAIEKNNYSTNDLVEIKIPLNNPYISDHSYKDAYGETTVKGKYYQYVKKKISDNILYLLCLPNEEKQTLISTKNNLEGNNVQTSPNKSNQKNPLQNILKTSATEYLRINQFLFANMFIINNDAQLFLLLNTNFYSQFNPQALAQPPEDLG